MNHSSTNMDSTVSVLIKMDVFVANHYENANKPDSVECRCIFVIVFVVGDISLQHWEETVRSLSAIGVLYITRISADIYQCIYILGVFSGDMIQADMHRLLLTAKQQHVRYIFGINERSVNVHCAYSKHIAHTAHISNERRESFIFIRLTRLIFTHVNHFNGKMHRLSCSQYQPWFSWTQTRPIHFSLGKYMEYTKYMVYTATDPFTFYLFILTDINDASNAQQ